MSGPFNNGSDEACMVSSVSIFPVMKQHHSHLWLFWAAENFYLLHSKTQSKVGSVPEEPVSSLLRTFSAMQWQPRSWSAGVGWLVGYDAWLRSRQQRETLSKFDKIPGNSSTSGRQAWKGPRRYLRWVHVDAEPAALGSLKVCHLLQSTLASLHLDSHIGQPLT